MSSSSIQLPVFQAKVSNIQNQADSSAVYSGGVWSLKNSTAVASVTISDAGNVGIGTASPGFALDVQRSSGAAQIRALNTSGTGADMRIIGSDGAQGIVGTFSNHVMTFYTNSAERMRIDASGSLLVGTTSAAVVNSRMTVASGAGTEVVLGNASETSLTNYSATVAKLYVARGNITLRSINAAGTVNASGADYAEYMTKAGDFSITKGDICGINAEGKLTSVFSEAVAFVVKSTNPSYVGGDTWGADLEAGSEELEAARQLVDRIAFCGQVPVNVLGAAPGQWIIPVEDNGGIKGEAVSSPSFEQYQKAVGKVIAVEADGRARIIVKIA